MKNIKRLNEDELRHFIEDLPPKKLLYNKLVIDDRRSVYTRMYEGMSWPFTVIPDLKDAVSVFPAIDSEGKGLYDSTILISQFRPGPNKFLFELPGGYKINGEKGSPEAVRELEEETGLKSNRSNLISLGKVYRDGYTIGMIDAYLGLFSPKNIGGQSLDRDEKEQGLDRVIVSLEVADKILNRHGLSAQPTTDTFNRGMRYLKSHDLISPDYKGAFD